MRVERSRDLWGKGRRFKNVRLTFSAVLGLRMIGYTTQSGEFLCVFSETLYPLTLLISSIRRKRKGAQAEGLPTRSRRAAANITP